MSSRMALRLMIRSNCISAQVGRNIQRKSVPLLAKGNFSHRILNYSTSKTETPQANQDVSDAAAASELTYDVKKLQDQINELTIELNAQKEKNDELIDKYKRALADSENLRTRLTKQIDDAKIYGIQSFCKDLLEVADTLACATDAVPKDQVDQNNHLKNLYEGLNMTKASLLHVFKRHGLEAVNPMQEKFNPNYHEALFQKPDSSVEPNTVVEVSKIGYTLHGRVIRPALVGVSKAT